MGALVDGAILLNIIANIYFKAKEAGVEVTPYSLKRHIEDLEAQADANDAIMGIQDEP